MTIFFLSVQITMNTKDVFSTPNTTAEAPEIVTLPSQNYNQLYIDIGYWMYKVSFLILPVFGGFGNILSFIVMQKDL